MLMGILAHRWKKVFVRDCQYDAEVNDRVEPREWVFDSKTNTFPGSTLVVFGKASRGDFHTVLGHFGHLWSEICGPMVVWVVWDAPESDETDKNSERGWNDLISFLRDVAAQIGLPSMIRNHFHPRRPRVPSIPNWMPAARRPDTQDDPMFPACQMAIRSGASSLVYHDDVIRLTMGKNGPSATPTKKRQNTKAQPDFIAAIHAVMPDQTMT